MLAEIRGYTSGEWSAFHFEHIVATKSAFKDDIMTLIYWYYGDRVCCKEIDWCASCVSRMHLPQGEELWTNGRAVM